MAGKRRASLACVTGLVLASATSAQAAGLYFGDRGVRPLGRAGAFVAGADDGGAIAYNPAGLAFAGHAYLGDFAWVNYTSTYQRKQLVAQVDPNTGQPTGQTWEFTFPEVEGRTPILPIPTAVYSNPLGQKDWNFAIGLHAPYAAITSFPEKVRGQPAPQRYSLITLDGSALAVLGAYASYRPQKEIALGAGVEALTGYFQTSVYFSACVPERFICAPEQPEYDAYGQLRVGPIVAPSGILGVILLPSDSLRIGASFHLPVWIDSPGTQKVRLPSAAVFDGASVSGDAVNVEFTLPWVLRLGVELRPTDKLAIEGGFAYEAWAMHDEIRVSSEDIALENVAGFPPVYKIPPLSIERGFQNTYSVRVGAEYKFPVSSYALGLRAGAMYEKSAIPKEYLSATTIDLDKVTLAVGGSLYLGKWRFDGVIARVIGTPVEVGTDEQRVKQLNPVLANPAANPNYINAGKYDASANVLGVGLVYQFDSPAEPPTKPSVRPADEDDAPATPKAKAKSEEPPETKAEPETRQADEDFEKAFEQELEKKPEKKPGKGGKKK
ncbi:MAG: outer membrane protein transport protein [Myxococcales bacterium]|nr:outer membrane protein transport protein [Myxococcales bacterium]